MRAASKTGERRTGGKSTKVKIRLSDGERERLERVAGHPRSLRKHAWRARIVLALGSGRGLMEMARRTGMSKRAVWRGRDRFLAEGVDGLLRNATRPSGEEADCGGQGEGRDRPRDVAAGDHRGGHARHWTVRALAEKMGMAVSTTHGILKGNGLKPHQVKTFKVSRDPRFELKVRDVVGLHVVNPLDHAVVLSVDEKPQIQALGGARRSLPMTSGHAETRTRDYRRHGEGRRAAPLGGVPRLPRPCRGGDRPRNPGARHPRQRVVAPLGRGPRVAEEPSRLDVSLHADLGVVDERRRGVLLEACAAAAEERGLRLSGRPRRGD